jgi:non-specific protein-tyrosine kinase
MTQSSLITLTNPRSPASEAYRTLRTNLSFTGMTQVLHTLVITSPAPEEGKSITLANLAVTFAQSGKKTLIVDCDLRRPTQHSIWGVAQEPGLTEAVLGTVKKLPLQKTGVENLSLITSGSIPPNPADLLGSVKMESLLKQLKAQADIILFDAPPMIAVTDATLIASQVDGVLLVLRAGSTRRDHAEQARDLLARAKVRLLGSVLTNSQVDKRAGGYYAES